MLDKYIKYVYMIARNLCKGNSVLYEDLAQGGIEYVLRREAEGKSLSTPNIKRYMQRDFIKTVATVRIRDKNGNPKFAATREHNDSWDESLNTGQTKRKQSMGEQEDDSGYQGN